MKKILISGCSGFLASFLVERLKTHSTDPVEIYGFTEEADYKSDDFTVLNLDIRDKDALFKMVETVKPDLTFHLAAVSNVGFSWKHQRLTYEINFIGSSDLLEALSIYSPKSRVLLMSSAELYGATSHQLLDESIPTTAANPYAVSKKAMELAGDLYLKSSQLEIIKCRSFNFTGPRQDKKFVSSDFSYQIAQIEKGLKEPRISVGNLSAVRDISDVRDIARYLQVISEKGENGGIYNLCCGQAFAIKDLLHMLLAQSSAKIEIVIDQNKMRPVDIPKLAGDNRLIRESFRLSPQYKLEQTLTDLLNYWRERV